MAIFTFHSVTDHPSAFARRFSLATHPVAFTHMVDQLAETFHLVSGQDLVEGRIPSRSAMITFDDGFADTFDIALPLLAQRSIPATVFVNMAVVRGAPFWAGLISHLCETSDEFRAAVVAHAGPPAPYVPVFLKATRQVVRTHLEGLSPKALSTLHSVVAEEVGPFVEEERLRRVDPALVALGSHLSNHYVALHLSTDELVASSEENAAALAGLPASVPLLAFPFGDPSTCFHPAQVDILLAHGMARVLSCAGGMNLDVAAPLLDRIAIEGDGDLLWWHICLGARL